MSAQVIQRQSRAAQKEQEISFPQPAACSKMAGSRCTGRGAGQGAAARNNTGLRRRRRRAIPSQIPAASDQVHSHRPALCQRTRQRATISNINYDNTQLLHEIGIPRNSIDSTNSYL
jgi:hypothetical protein